MKRRIIIASLIGGALALGIPANGHSYTWNDARAIALGGSYSAVARGYDAIGFNPANLAFADGPRLQIQLFALGSGLNNNSLSLSDYHKYNGAYLSPADRHDILSQIPEEGIEFKGNIAASLLSCSRGPLVVSTTAEIAGSGTLSRDAVDLAFFGNSIGKTISLRDTGGEALAHVDVNFAYGHLLHSYSWGDLAAGVNLKYIHGLTYFNVSKSYATSVTGTGGLDADGYLTARSSRGGEGLGFDCGVAAQCRSGWIFSLGIKNAGSFIHWNRDAKITDYQFEISSLSAETADESGTVVSDEVERAVGSFYSSLATQINLGAAHAWGNFLLASDLKFGMEKKAGATTTPELSLGTEYQRLSFLPLRAGISIGGFHGLSVALGGGFKLYSFYIDFAWASSGTVYPTIDQGFSLAISSGLSFAHREEVEILPEIEMDTIRIGPDYY